MEPYEDKTCKICEHDVKSPSSRASDEVVTVHCWRCGDYEIVPEAYHRLSWRFADQKRHVLSGRARMSKIETGVIHRFDVEEVEAMVNMQIREKTYGESALSVMRYLSAHRPGEQVLLSNTDNSVGYCQNFRELWFVVDQLSRSGLLNLLDPADIRLLTVTLSGLGWQWIENQITQGTGQQAFIAMSFSDALAGTMQALKAGILAAGYHPVLVSDREFTDGIVDRIFTEIRRSRFVVADFTENKAGVYYEAGFGLGLGLTVIGTCEASHLDPKSSNHLHFDVRGLNMIPWTAGKPDDLTRRLTQRILAKFPQGPVKPEQQ